MFGRGEVERGFQRREDRSVAAFIRSRHFHRGHPTCTIDVTAMLPADEAGHGFDNVTVTDLSPTLLSRYISWQSTQF